MAIQDEYDRDVDVTNYIKGKNRMTRDIDEIISILDIAVAFKTKYPDDTTEIDQGITWVKGRCQNIIDGY